MAFHPPKRSVKKQAYTWTAMIMMVTYFLSWWQFPETICHVTERKEVIRTMSHGRYDPRSLLALEGGPGERLTPGEH